MRVKVNYPHSEKRFLICLKCGKAHTEWRLRKSNRDANGHKYKYCLDCKRKKNVDTAHKSNFRYLKQRLSEKLKEVKREDTRLRIIRYLGRKFFTTQDMNDIAHLLKYH